MSERKQEFRIEFNCFADYGREIEASFIIDPTFELVFVTDMQHSPETVRVLNLVFRKVEGKKLGRRGYSLKKEWEQTPNGEVPLDLPVSTMKTFLTGRPKNE